MYSISKKTSLLILGVTALVCSKIFFSLFNDPEGPNLLIVVVMALILYGVSVAVHARAPLFTTSLKKLLVAIFIQIVLVTVFYIFLK